MEAIANSERINSISANNHMPHRPLDSRPGIQPSEKKEGPPVQREKGNESARDDSRDDSKDIKHK
jgi:hypothetical protein